MWQDISDLFRSGAKRSIGFLTNDPSFDEPVAAQKNTQATLEGKVIEQGKQDLRDFVQRQGRSQPFQKSGGAAASLGQRVASIPEFLRVLGKGIPHQVPYSDKPEQRFIGEEKLLPFKSDPNKFAVRPNETILESIAALMSQGLDQFMSPAMATKQRARIIKDLFKEEVTGPIFQNLRESPEAEMLRKFEQTTESTKKRRSLVPEVKAASTEQAPEVPDQPGWMSNKAAIRALETGEKIVDSPVGEFLNQTQHPMGAIFSNLSPEEKELFTQSRKKKLTELTSAERKVEAKVSRNIPKIGLTSPQTVGLTSVPLFKGDKGFKLPSKITKETVTKIGKTGRPLYEHLVERATFDQNPALLKKIIDVMPNVAMKPHYARYLINMLAN